MSAWQIPRPPRSPGWSSPTRSAAASSTSTSRCFQIGRRSETDLRLPGADISRVHAEITLENGHCTIRDKQSRFGTFVNGERTNEKVLAHGDQIRFGQAGDTEIVFFVDDEAPSVEKSAISAATELRQMAALLEGLRALGSGRVLDEVLALVLDSAIEVTGAERGFIMMANEQNGQLEFKLARARGKVTLSGRTFETSRKIPESVFATGKQTIVEDLLDGDLAQLHTGTVALGIRHVLCTPLRLVRYVERAEQKGADELIGVLYLDSRERGALRSASATAGARHAVGRSGARDRERAALSRSARQGEVRAGAQGRGGDSTVAAAGGEPRRRFLLDGRGIDRLPRGGRRLLRLRRSADRPLRLHPRRRGGQRIAGGAAGGGGAGHVQRRGDLSDRRGDADDAAQHTACSAARSNRGS